MHIWSQQTDILWEMLKKLGMNINRIIKEHRAQFWATHRSPSTMYQMGDTVMARRTRSLPLFFPYYAFKLFNIYINKEVNNFGEWQCHEDKKTSWQRKSLGGGRQWQWLALLDTRMKSGFLEQVTFELGPEGEKASHERVEGQVL